MKNIVGGESLFRFGFKTIAIIVLALTIGVVSYYGTSSMGEKLEEKEMESLQKAVQRSIVQCYALEGQYPPSIEYLEENYGLQIDKDKYLIDYNSFASNIMPQATVVSLTSNSGGESSEN